MNDISPELNHSLPNKDNRSVKSRLKKVAGKVVLSTPLAGLILSSGNVDNPNVPIPKIKEPTPASAPLTSLPLPTEIPTLTPIVHVSEPTLTQNMPTPETPVDIRKTSKVEKEFINKMRSKYGLEVVPYLMLPGANKAIYGSQTLTEDEIHEIERSLSLTPYCPKNFYRKLIIGKVPEREPYFLGNAQYGFNYIEMNIVGSKTHMKEFFEGKTFQTPDILGKVLAHECGHMINYRIMHLSSASYPDTIDGRLNIEIDMLKIPENKNPLYVIFSRLINWKFDGEKYKRTNPDPRIKGGHYNGSLNEFFAEMFAMFKYRPDLLTKQEHTFFTNLDNGLSREGDSFLKKVIADPEILLESQFRP